MQKIRETASPPLGTEDASLSKVNRIKRSVSLFYPE